MLSKVFSAVIGLNTIPVEKERVRNSKTNFPARRITVNLVPADLPIAREILLASRELQADFTHALISGELSVDEFSRRTVESLRQPIENTTVSISRTKSKTTFLAKGILIANQNSCPCGYLGDKSHHCIGTVTQTARYKMRVFNPLLDRIDIHLDTPIVKVETLTKQETNHVENSQTVRVRIQKARNKQQKRYGGATTTFTNKTIKLYCKLSDDCINLLCQAVSCMDHSGKAYYRIIKLSRTITDLANKEDSKPYHIAEALQYHPKGETY